MRGNRSIVRRVGAAALIAGLALVVFASVASAEETTPTDTPAAVTEDVTTAATGSATLKSAHVGSTNPGFGTGSCPSNTTGFPGDWGWHFVFQGSTTDFATLTVTFDAPPHDDVAGGSDSNPADNLTISGNAVGAGGTQAFVSHPNAKHAYVFTPGPGYMLLSGSATTSGTDLDTEFNLSHVCAGTTTTTTTAPPTTTTIEVSPTTVVQGPAVEAGAAQQLPRTGSFSLPMLLIGLGLIVGGALALARSGPRADALSEL